MLAFEDALSLLFSLRRPSSCFPILDVTHAKAFRCATSASQQASFDHPPICLFCVKMTVAQMQAETLYWIPECCKRQWTFEPLILCNIWQEETLWNSRRMSCFNCFSKGWVISQWDLPSSLPTTPSPQVPQPHSGKRAERHHQSLGELPGPRPAGRETLISTRHRWDSLHRH